MQKAVEFLKFELELLNLKIQFPNSFSVTDNIPFKPELYITPKSKGLGVIGIAEIIISIFLSKEIKDRNGKPASLIQLAKAFEYVFNFNFGSIYDKQAEIYNRKACNLTKALDFLRNTLEQIRKSALQDKNRK
ncbi:RteC domain-containing protein [Dysgonomonas sp. Marseille-P4361]|jgi:hypothetical protein|uniref:RteC domain-containing protein n=1 Tax=Dysgonomonas sp. Marseille-P4361 TaxID=2161820 RepID=UPI000D554FA0|nr:RteC domain-containing protein [Dysgonomonas sp. Marseille-P4361]